MDRPKLNEILARIDAGESDGIVVYRLDRFGRTLIGALTIIERLYERREAVRVGMDNFDISTENGRLVLRIMLSLGQYERERIQSTWRRSRDNAVERGWHVSGSRPFGYQREIKVAEQSGKTYKAGLIVDPTEGPLVTELFRRRAAGESHKRLARWLESNGVTTSRGKTTWSIHAVQSILKNSVYLGVARGTWNPADANPDAHAPLTDPATWQAAQGGTAPKRAANGATHPALAMGIVRCAGCRYVAGVMPRRRLDAWDYRCRRQTQAGDCPEPINAVANTTTGAPTLDDVISEQVLARLRERVAFEAIDAGDGVDLDGLEADWLRAAAKAEDCGTDFALEAEIGTAVWRKRCAVLARIADEKLEILTQARRRSARAESLGRPVRELADDWHHGRLSLDEKRQIVANMVQAVFVRQVSQRAAGKVSNAAVVARMGESLRNRVHIVWADEPPVDVPRQGRRDWDPKPFEFPASTSHPDHAGVLGL
jgi:DNA invertase Pin-like site-specific DNA recombinase